MYKYVLFDLDGTLTDSKEGIINSVAYALEKMGISSEGRLDPHVIVGPPLLDTFEGYYGFSPEKARQAYSFFQERYSTIGKFENRAFEGIVPLLKNLKEKGIRSFVATSKPQVHAEAICEKFGLAPYLEAIAGPAIGGTDSKADVMARILKGIGSIQKGEAVMVGDRKFDIIGAHELGLPVIYAGYGYGNGAERKEYRPDISPRPLKTSAGCCFLTDSFTAMAVRHSDL